MLNSNGLAFLQRLKSIYILQKACILVNGELTKPSEIQKGTRQVCPLSPFFFILVTGLLNKDINQENRVKRLQIKAHKYKLWAFVDDLVLVLQDPLENIKYAMRKIKVFREMAGLKIKIKGSAQYTACIQQLWFANCGL